MLEKTEKTLDLIAKDSFFTTYDVKFVGGTALSYLINHRLSEDLDFAMLDLCPKEIKNMMINKYQATQLPHDIALVDSVKNEGGDLEDYYLKFMLHGVKVEFFSPPFNMLEKEIWNSEPSTSYKNTNIQVASFKTIMYMKTMAFWNRKKYRDLFDIYYVLSNNHSFTVEDFIELYIKYNITYDKEILYKKIRCKESFYKKPEDEGLSTLVKDHESYEWYRKKIEGMVHNAYLQELYE
ncbi:MAG: hypothetical protein COB67_05945 [SAR324 cluster bacterium]|uniref:Nucleotidyl transferase AbiEii/AbiGii toxin family protein n=1 Tax=SAR324 cluster bacterium TaxID=2024889 RepID=A0A2A4T5P2_9DELT|nr:MAG: hypothetical protein COB67_05945 [SAR324 cluster bacterium]